jgi:hypothetical protein
MWKPYIIYKKLLEIDVNDILIYSDCGMSIYNNNNVKNKFNNIFSLLNNKNKCPTGICTFITTGIPDQRKEFQWNTIDIFKHFNVQDNKNITHTQQVQAGIVCIKKIVKV